MKIWSCKIGEVEEVPDASDAPMRYAVAEAYRNVTGEAAQFVFSGWGAELTADERCVVDGRASVHEGRPKRNGINHTPAPWVVCKCGYGVGVKGENEVTELIADLWDSPVPHFRRPNAEHIVRCVNAYDTLLAAIQQITNGAFDCTVTCPSEIAAKALNAITHSKVSA